jgi:hypothetical protein
MSERIEKANKSYDIYDAYREVCLSATVLLQKITFSETNLLQAFKNFKSDFTYLFNLTSAHPDIDMDIEENNKLIDSIDEWLNGNYTMLFDEAKRNDYISRGLVKFQEYKRMLVQKKVIVFD